MPDQGWGNQGCTRTGELAFGSKLAEASSSLVPARLLPSRDTYVLMIIMIIMFVIVVVVVVIAIIIKEN